MNVNEPPAITAVTQANFVESRKADVLTVKAHDPDKDNLAYKLSGGADAALFEISTNGILRFRTPPDYDAPTDANRNNIYEAEITVSDAGGLSDSKLFKITVTNDPADDGVVLQLRAILQGAYNSNTKLMSSELNRLGLLPAQQPYSTAPFNHKGQETLGEAVKQASGKDAAVDWVLVELRSDNNNVVASRAAILQSDGDIVDAQSGAAFLHFPNVPAGNYSVSLRHRNHLDITTASPANFGTAAVAVDFANASTPVKGKDARLSIGTLAMLWAGDINGDQQLAASGPRNDATLLLSSILLHQDNPQTLTNYVMKGYSSTDLNLDGKTQFSGPGNDTGLLLGNIILHPANTNFVGNYIVRGGY